MIYGSFCLQAQQHPLSFWLYIKSGSLNSPAKWLLINILLSFLTPQVYATTSFLVLIFLINAASHSIMNITLSNGWNTIFLFAMPWNFFPIAITLLYQRHLNSTLNMISLVTPLPQLLQHAFFKLNINRPTSMMLLLIKTTSCSIGNATYLTSCQNTKNYSISLLEFILIRRSTLTSNLELNRCITKHTMILMSIGKSLKRNLTTWWSLVSLNHAGPLNGHPQPLLSLKRIVAFNKLLTYTHSINQSFANNNI